MLRFPVALFLVFISSVSQGLAATVELIANGSFASGTLNNWTSWTFSRTGSRGGFTAFTNPGPNSQEDNGGTLDLTQSGMVGLTVGPGALGAAQIIIQTGWNTCGTNPASLNIYIGATLYGTFTTPSNAATGATTATTTYSNGATGTAGSAIPATPYTAWTYRPWTINLPTTVASTGSLRLSFAQPVAGCNADISVQSVSLRINTPTLTVTKISNGLTGAFTLTGTNGWTSQTITTATSGTGVAGPLQVLTATGTATTITEAANTNYVMTGVTCSGLGSGGTVTPNLLAGTISFDAAATAIGANITCTVTNTKSNPSLTIAKTFATAATPVVLGQTVTYSYAVTNNGNVPMQNVQVSDMHGTPAVLVATGGLGVTNENLTAAGSFGASASSDTTPNDGIWTTLAPGASVRFTYTHQVTQAEIDRG